MKKYGSNFINGQVARMIIISGLLAFGMLKTAAGYQQVPTDLPKTDVERMAISTADQVAGFFAKLSKSVMAGDMAAAEGMMTATAADKYAAGILLMGVDFKDQDPGLVEGDVNAILRRYKLGSLELTDYFYDISCFNLKLTVSEKKILAVVDKQATRWEAVNAIRTALGEFAWDVMPFSNDTKILEHLEAKDGAVMRVLAPGSDYDCFLLFNKSENGWKWAGFDPERQAAFDKAYNDSIGEPFPLVDNLTLSGLALSGKQVDLKDYRGKYVLVDFWGTWCVPCVAELPGLMKIYAALKEHGFEVLGVGEDDASTLKAFVNKKHKLPWENIVDGEGEIADRLSVDSFPTTLLIDDQGKHVESDLSGIDLLEELIVRMKLDSDQFNDLRVQLENHADDEDKEEEDREPKVKKSFTDQKREFSALVEPMLKCSEAKGDVGGWHQSLAKGDVGGWHQSLAFGNGRAA